MQIVDGLNSIALSLPGIQSIVVTDKDGVEILSAPTDALKDPTTRQNAQLLSAIFNLTNEQCQKLEDFGSTESFTAIFERTLICQSAYPPFTITVRADRNKVSDWAVIEIVEAVKSLLKDLRNKIGTVII